jgi:death-on-curing protein
MTRYLAAADLIAMNDQILQRAGTGTGTLRDLGALESAVMRPQMASHYEDADLVSQTATLIAGVALAHAFIDGNKRTALAAGTTFLLLNGRRRVGDAVDLAQQIEALVSRTGPLGAALIAFAAWLRPWAESDGQ